MAAALNTADGRNQLNAYLADKSYIEGFLLSTSDVEVFTAISPAPTAATHAHLARWYSHVNNVGAAARSAAKAGTAGFVAKAFAAAPAAAAKAGKSEEIDLFGSDDSEDEAEMDAIRAEQKRKNDARTAEKMAAGKSSILYNVKPYDSETDMAVIEAKIREIAMDGLLWGASKLVPVVRGINMLQIMCTVYDTKVSTDLLEEIMKGENEDNPNGLDELVQSIDIAAFNKI
eukprot:c46870_g1_i1.p1 GENE.c46870_g1_i1~~c46870_g1_i1.p1  ORF type:complete len:243 (+),score=68.75 c46870_g1_i1:40-729(+)